MQFALLFSLMTSISVIVNVENFQNMEICAPALGSISSVYQCQLSWLVTFLPCGMKLADFTFSDGQRVGGQKGFYQFK